MKKTAVLVALAALLTARAVSAQEYVLNIKHGGPADKTDVKRTVSGTMDMKFLDAKGGELGDKKQVTTQVSYYRDTVLERAAAGEDVVKVKRHYERAELTLDGMQRILSFQGKTLFIAKKDGRFQFQNDRGELIEGADAVFLNAEYNNDGFPNPFAAPFLPAKAVKVEESWKFDVAALAKLLGKNGEMEFDVANSKGSGKLLKVYQKNGKQFGVIELTMEFPIANWITDGKKSPAKDSKLTIRQTRDGCIDGNTDQTLTIANVDSEIRRDMKIDGANVVSSSIMSRSTAEELRVPLGK